MASANTAEGKKKGLLARFKEIGGTPADHPPWRLIYNFDYFLQCKRKNCSELICKEARALISHRKICFLGRACPMPNCWMYAPVCMHYSTCKSDTCAECVEIKTKVAEHKALFSTHKSK